VRELSDLRSNGISAERLGPEYPPDVDLRQAAEEFSAAVADAMALSERVKLLQEELIAQVNEQTRLTVLRVVMTVLVFLDTLRRRSSGYR